MTRCKSGGLADIAMRRALRSRRCCGPTETEFVMCSTAPAASSVGKPMRKLTWITGFDAKGRPTGFVTLRRPGRQTNSARSNQGATNWYSPSFSPRTGLFYIPTWVGYYSTFYESTKWSMRTGQRPRRTPRSVVPGAAQCAATSIPAYQKTGVARIRAVNPQTGERKWEFKLTDVTDSGILRPLRICSSTGRPRGSFYALDAKTGKMLWKTMVGAQVASGPITYSVGGRQYLAFCSGNGMFVYALRQ